jgi:hypothetical protein
MNVARIISLIKVIIGLTLLFLAFLITKFAVTRVVRYGDTIQIIWVPVVIGVGFAILGLFLIVRWRSAMARGHKILILGASMGMPIVGAFLLHLAIGHRQSVVKHEAELFSFQAVPNIFKGDSEGGVSLRYVGPNADGLSYSHALINRYAKDGQIPWSARINGDMSIALSELSCYERANAVTTNQQASLYLTNCRRILLDINRILFWQLVEDTINSKLARVI